MTDQLASFATMMNFTACTTNLIQTIRHQEDARGYVTRTSFISAVSSAILFSYLEQVNADRELQLRQSVHLDLSSHVGKNTYKYLSLLFDSLDVTQEMRLPSVELIALLSLLSKEPINDRLYSFVKDSGTMQGNQIYLSTLTAVFDGFFLFLDLLLPTVNSQMHVGHGYGHSLVIGRQHP